MSVATGHGMMMVGAGWWPSDDDATDPTNVACAVERTDEDEVAVMVRPVGPAEDGVGSLYLTPEMAAQLSSMLIEQAADSAWERKGTAAS